MVKSDLPQNNFESLDECETTCPNSFPPEIKASAEVSKLNKIS